MALARTCRGPLIKRRGTFYQILLITFGVIVLGLIGAFFYREAFPEYKVYQETYLELEKARGVDPKFQTGIKQILYYSEEPGPENIDRCVSCHVTMQLPHFSPTRIALDVNGNVRYDAAGVPIQEPNPDYVFNSDYLRYQEVGGLPVDMAKVLVMHPLLGSETRPFEFHPLDQYGCTSCHSGNGRSVNTKRAHGPVFDEEYEVAEGNPINPYVEVDEENDPQIARVFNFKPGHDLLFQTTPILPGSLMEAKCAQCHQPGAQEVEGVLVAADILEERKEAQAKVLTESVANDRAAIAALEEIQSDLKEKGVAKTVELYATKLEDPALTPEERDAFDQRMRFIQGNGENMEARIEERITHLRKGLSEKEASLAAVDQAVRRLDNAKQPFIQILDDNRLVKEIASQAAPLLGNYERGQELFISQACYGCHRIAGVSRGGVGPDLTEAGLSYPWWIKMSIVWPQGKLPGSAMPNFKLDHEEVEDLMAYLMAQTGETKAISQVQKEVRLKAWEAGHPNSWERPISPGNIKNVEFAMNVFANQGCAACHKLKGFEGNVEFPEASKAKDTEWFWRTFPEQITGRSVVKRLYISGEKIDQTLLYNDRKGTLLEQIDLLSFYAPFRFAMRAQDAEYRAMMAQAVTQEQRDAAENFRNEWQDRVRRVLIMYVQQYGLGRDIGPRLNWSGVWRDDEWLTGHFLNPTAYSPRSIMPAFPFDITKFYSLNNMLHVLGERNRDDLQAVWEARGFDPALAYQLMCSACHGDQKQGNGPIAEWIYPIPKNLRNAQFLKNLTREQAKESIVHGVKGTPMPPWGESAFVGKPPVLTEAQIDHLVDWLYSTLPASPLLGEPKATKWEYSPDDVVVELEREKSGLNVTAPDQLFTPDGYIEEKYYTPINLEAGQQVFMIHCAHCHGNEAAGNGPRAETMVDAKPRMLTNLPWLQSRNDMRLLRSIKYGVPGTSMTALGDQTNALQRLQVVMYIRSLAREKIERDQLQKTLYDAYDTVILAIENCRIGEYEKKSESESEYEKAIDEREALLEKVQQGEAEPDAAAAAYAKELTLMGEVKKRQSLDETLQKLISLVREEQRYYNRLGETMVAKDVEPELFEDYLRWVEARGKLFEGAGGCVEKSESESESESEGEIGGEVVVRLDAGIQGLEEERVVAAGRIRSGERDEELQRLTEEQRALFNLKSSFLGTVRETDRMRAEQLETFGKYQKKKKELE